MTKILDVVILMFCVGLTVLVIFCGIYLFKTPEFGPVIFRTFTGVNFIGYEDGEGSILKTGTHQVKHYKRHGHGEYDLITECHADVEPIDRGVAGYDVIRLNTIPCKLKENDHVHYLYKKSDLKKNAYINPDERYEGIFGYIAMFIFFGGIIGTGIYEMVAFWKSFFNGDFEIKDKASKMTNSRASILRIMRKKRR